MFQKYSDNLDPTKFSSRQFRHRRKDLRWESLVQQACPYVVNCLLLIMLLGGYYIQGSSIANQTAGIYISYLYIICMGGLYGKRQSMLAAAISMLIFFCNNILQGGELLSIIYSPADLLCCSSYGLLGFLVGYVAESRKYKNADYSTSASVVKIFCLVLVIGVFCQLGRMNVFLHLNQPDKLEFEKLPMLVSAMEKEWIPQERFIVLYNPADVQSVLTNHNVVEILQEQKKECRSLAMYNDFILDDSCSGVVLATGDVDRIKNVGGLLQYVAKGGRVVCLQRIKENTANAGLLSALGVEAVGGEGAISGIKVKDDIMLGLNGLSLDMPDYYNDVTAVRLSPNAKVHITSYNNLPLVWEQDYGKGRFILFNGMERDDKIHYGLMTALLSQLHDDYIYPVVNAKVIYLDNVPSDVPRGKNDRLYAEVNMDMEEFFRKLWWPEMKRLSREIKVRYTGLLPFNGDEQSDTIEYMSDIQRNDLLLYGRELMNMGGELGLVGTEAKIPQYMLENFPGYDFSVYNHEDMADDTYGCSLGEMAYWKIYSDVNYRGVFYHHFSPYEILYDRTNLLTWKKMKTDMEFLVRDSAERFPWLESVTRNEAENRLSDYLALNYRVERKTDGFTIYSWNYRKSVNYILRTTHEISSIDGGTMEKIQENAYLIRILEPVTDIHFSD